MPACELIGQTEDLIFGAEVGAHPRAEDQWVMEIGQPYQDVTRLVDGENARFTS
jgi:hypothetical protein